MLMPGEIVALDEAHRAAAVRLVAPPKSPFADAQGSLDPVALLEAMAQAAAAHHAAARGPGRAPEDVMLVALRQATIHGEARTGDELDVEVRIAAEAPPAVSVVGAVRRRGVLLAEAAFTAWHGPAAS